MRYYFVDYENVHEEGLKGITELTEQDTVYIFYSKNAQTLTFDLHHKLNESKATLSFEKVTVGTKHALDFQLATFLGYLIAENRGEEFLLITKDKGYQCLCSYWKAKNINISICQDVTGRALQDEESELSGKVNKLIEDENIVRKVVGIMQKYKTKQEIHSALVKQYPSKGGNKQASQIYNLIKPLLADK